MAPSHNLRLSEVSGCVFEGSDVVATLLALGVPKQSIWGKLGEVHTVFKSVLVGASVLRRALQLLMILRS